MFANHTHTTLYRSENIGDERTAGKDKNIGTFTLIYA